MSTPTFLGTGLMRPLRRDQKNDFASGGGVDLVASCIGQVLGTKADTARSPGELPWRTDFGSRLHLLRHRNHTAALDDVALVYVVEALRRWEPRVSVTSASVERTTNNRELIVRVRFNVVDRGGRIVITDQQATVPVAIAA